jgi:hypothetical protein
MDPILSDILTKLYLLGYQLEATGEQVRVRWQGECPPPQAIVSPLFAEAQRRQPDILMVFARPALTVDGKNTPAQTQVGLARDRVAVLLDDLTRCAWCGSTQLRFITACLDPIYCRECHSVNYVSEGYRTPGDSAKHHLAVEPPPTPRVEPT